MLDNVNRLYREGKFDEAIIEAEKALKALQTRWGSADQWVGLALKFLAGLYSNVLRYGEAEKHYRRSISIYAAASGEHERVLVVVLDEFSDFLTLLERHAEAASSYQQAAALVEKLQGHNHPDLAIALNKLGLAYDKLGQYEKAAALYIRCIEIREKALGPDSQSWRSRSTIWERRIGAWAERRG